MPQVGARARAVVPSGIREIVNLVVGRGGDIMRLEIGEPGYPTPGHIVEAGAAAARAGARYTPSAGMMPLRAAIAERLARNGVATSPEQVIVCAGAVQGCTAVLAALLDAGGEVLVPDPAWPNYEMIVTMLGGRPVRYPQRPQDGFVPDPDQVEALLTDRTVALVVNSPANPTGAVLPPRVVAALVDVARRRGIVLLSDEVYDELVFEGAAPNAAALDPEIVVGLYSFSKTYAMTGWRVGYVAAPGWLARTLQTLQEPLVASTSEISQRAALAALTGPQDAVAAMREGYRSRRDLVLGLLEEAGIRAPRPSGAFYVMVPLAPGADSRTAALDLVEHGVSVAPGTAFGAAAADHVRVSLASEEPVLREGIARLVRWHGETGGGKAVAAA